jgi:hypothetical protein
MRKNVVVADEDLLGFHEVRDVEVRIDSSAAEASARHVLASPADDAVVKGKVVIFRVEFFDVALDDGDSPAFGQSVVVEHLQHVLIPKKSFFGGVALVDFLDGEGDIPVIAEVKVILDDPFTYDF